MTKTQKELAQHALGLPDNMADIKIDTGAVTTEKALWLSVYCDAAKAAGASISPPLEAQNAVEAYREACTRFLWLP